MLPDLLLVAAGLAALTAGGEALIRGALALAARWGLSPLLCGLLIVGFGTSAPELAVSLDAALRDQPDIALGNVVGSNIGNIGLILALCALISPLAVAPQALRRDGRVMLGGAALLFALAADGQLGRLDAALLLGTLITYLAWAYMAERRQPDAEGARLEQEAGAVHARPAGLGPALLATMGGLGLLIVGSRLLLAGAVDIATALGLPESVIGLTLVAVGTSLPELSVSLMAALRRQADVAVGNVLGSNIFNALGILGVSAAIQPLPVAARIGSVDLYVMLGASALLLVLLTTGRRLARGEGALLLAGYALYLGLSLVA